MDYPKLNIIFDSRRHERYEPLIAELSRQNITNYELFPCIIYDNVVASINASHKMIVREAKKLGLEEVLIGEDDLMIPHEKGFEWFLKNKPDIYEIYAAASYMAFKRPDSHRAIRVDCIVGFHLYFVHSRYYDIFLETDDKKHIDTEQKGKFMYVCYPFAALQRQGYSWNNKAIVNYNSIITDPNDIYQ